MMLIVAAIGAGAASASARVYVSQDCLDARYRPHQVIVTCGDGRTYLANLSWMRWTSRSAIGAGTFDQRTCHPDCADGATLAYRARVRLGRPRYCGRNRVKQFSRAHVTFTGHVPAGFHRRATLRLACAALPF